MFLHNQFVNDIKIDMKKHFKYIRSSDNNFLFKNSNYLEETF